MKKKTFPLDIGEKCLKIALNKGADQAEVFISKLKRESKKMDPWRASMIERKAGFLWEEELMAPKKERDKLD